MSQILFSALPRAGGFIVRTVTTMSYLPRRWPLSFYLLTLLAQIGFLTGSALLLSSPSPILLARVVAVIIGLSALLIILLIARIFLIDYPYFFRSPPAKSSSPAKRNNA
jgi:hypothetical protein